MEAVLQRAKKFADSKEIEFLVVIQPSVIDLARNNSVLNYTYLKRFAEYKNSKLTAAVENICLRNNIHVINLFDVFRNNNPDAPFFKGKNDHWSDRGQDLAAKETATYITRQLKER